MMIVWGYCPHTPTAARIPLTHLVGAIPPLGPPPDVLREPGYPTHHTPHGCSDSTDTPGRGHPTSRSTARPPPRTRSPDSPRHPTVTVGVTAPTPPRLLGFHRPSSPTPSQSSDHRPAPSTNPPILTHTHY